MDVTDQQEGCQVKENCYVPAYNLTTVYALLQLMVTKLHRETAQR